MSFPLPKRKATVRLLVEPLEHRDLLSASPLSLPALFTDLGRVDFSTTRVEAGQLGKQWFRFTPQNTATLTAICGTSPGQPSAGSIAIYAAIDNHLIELAQGAGRVDTQVTAGATYFASLVGVQSGEQFWLANLVNFSPAGVSVLGTENSESFTYDGANRLTVNGIAYQLPGAWGSLSINAGSGNDSAVITTGLAGETIAYSPGSLAITTANRSIRVLNVGNLSIQASPTGVVEVSDSEGDDGVILAPQYVSLTGSGFSVAITGPSVIHTFARNGGEDSVTFFDSPQADQASYNNLIAILQGKGFYNRAKFFESITFVATPGAEDTALLFGTKGADRLSGRLGDVRLDAGGVSVRATNFWTTVVRSAGGTDTAELDDSPQDDWVFSFPGDVTLFNQDLTVKIVGFAFSHVYSRYGGFDTAYFYDSPGDDLFIGRHDLSSFSTSPYFSRVKFFDAVYAYSRNGGRDTAQLCDSPGNDELTIRPLYVRLTGAGFSNRVETFATVTASSSSGGNDRVFGYGSNGVDQVTMTATRTDFFLAETQTLVTSRGFKQESYTLDGTDVVSGAASRVTVTRGLPSTVIYAVDYFDPTSPTLGFQQAIDALPEEGGIVILPVGEFQLRQGLVLRSNVTLRGSDAGTVLRRVSQAFAYLTAEARPGDQKIAVTSTAGFRIGDEISLLSRAVASASRDKTFVIAGIEGNMLILDRPISENILLPEVGAEVTNIFSVIRAEGTPTSPVVNVRIENIKVDGNLQSSYRRWRVDAPATIYLGYAVGSTIKGVTVVKSPTTGIVLEQGRDNLVENCTVEDSRRDGIALGSETDTIIRGCTVRGSGYGMTGDWGEGILVNGGRDIRVENCLTEYNLGKGLHPAGDLTIGGLWVNNVSRYNGGNGFHFCYNNFGIWVVGNELYGNAYYGVGGLGLGGDYGDRFNVVMSNVIYGNQRNGIFVNGGRDNLILNNQIGPNSALRAGQFAEIRLGEVYSTVIEGNTITPTPGAWAIDSFFAKLFNSIRDI
ncbi:MAG: right-handed parallel beta-helix repeat-containing protein [Thermogutta sp.]